MKVILSRKGFDSSNGGIPSPILPDGTMLSMPIPSNDPDTYDGLFCAGTTYSELLHQLAPKKHFGHCHVDPDIRDHCRMQSVKDWKPAFGQINAAQGVLSNAGVEPGDLFLFFGWFRKVELYKGKYRFVRRGQGTFYDHADLHAIYGYMQIGGILNTREQIERYPWHPHSTKDHLENNTNALYIPTETLSFLPDRLGYGTLDFCPDRVLTKENCKRGTWNALPFLMPEHVYGQRKNSASGDGLFYNGIWQELVIYETQGLLDWVKTVIQSPAAQ